MLNFDLLGTQFIVKYRALRCNPTAPLDKVSFDTLYEAKSFQYSIRYKCSHTEIIQVAKHELQLA